MKFNPKNIYDVIIIGTGPGGLFCAINCIEISGTKILLIEKNNSPGRKFLLSGSGQCNITHTGAVSDFIKHYGKRGAFVKPALNSFTPASMIKFLHDNGILTAEHDTGKIFPKSNRAADVLNMMISLCKEKDVEFMYNSPVEKIVNDDGLFTVHSANGILKSQILVIATGGMSYPDTGSTGDGYRFAQYLGHKIIAATPSLTPVYIKDFSLSRLSGLSFKNRAISLYKNGKKVYSSSEDILITHKGLSGPAILDMSRYIDEGDILRVSFSSKKIEEINNELIAESRLHGRMSIKNFLKRFDLPERFILDILNSEMIDSTKNISEINKTDRMRLLKAIGEHDFMVEYKGNFNAAMATAGGVCVDEIDNRTMESKLVPNLYFAGEVIDIDGDTGGYNIQWAFSSGKTAADAIKIKLKKL
jgi:predicted Rossmann fold flavoprotein